MVPSLRHSEEGGALWQAGRHLLPDRDFDKVVFPVHGDLVDGRLAVLLDAAVLEQPDVHEGGRGLDPPTRRVAFHPGKEVGQCRAGTAIVSKLEEGVVRGNLLVCVQELGDLLLDLIGSQALYDRLVAVPQIWNLKTILEGLHTYILVTLLSRLS